MPTFRVLFRMEVSLAQEVEADSLSEAVAKAEEAAYFPAAGDGLDETDWEVGAVTNVDTDETVWLRGENPDEDLD